MGVKCDIMGLGSFVWYSWKKVTCVKASGFFLFQDGTQFCQVRFRLNYDDSGKIEID